jgi:hypothetical protein
LTGLKAVFVSSLDRKARYCCSNGT